MEWLIRHVVHRRVAAVVVSLVIAAYGVTAFLHTSIEAFPDVTNVQVTVIAQLAGYAPEEIERQLTVPLERALNGTPGMIALRSESLYGLSIVTLTFEDGADTFVARSTVAQRAETADLPTGVVPELAPEATPLGEIYQFRLVSDRHDLYQLRSELDFTVARVMKQVQGVADLVSFGGYLREYVVQVDPARLQQHGVSLAEVVAALEQSNMNVGGGFLEQGDQELTVRGLGLMQGADDIRAVVLRASDGTPVTIGDVATRVVQAPTPRRGDVGFGVEPEAVEGFVLLRRGENPSEVLERVHAKVAELNDHILPAGMKIEPFYDRTTLVDHTLDTVKDNLLHGFLLIVGLVWLFVRSLSGSLAVASVIPLALLTAFIGLAQMHLPANLISLGAIDFGILVDGAVVLVENVLHRKAIERPATRLDIVKLVIRSAKDVARPTLFAMAIIIAALIPVFTLERVEGRIFRPLALTYSFALGGALVFSLTVVPALCALLLRPERARPAAASATRKSKHEHAAEPRFVSVLRAAYRRSLGFVVKRPLIALALGGGLVATTILVGTTLGSEFLPELDEGDVVVFVEMPASISLARSAAILTDVRKAFMDTPEVLGVLSEHGRPEDGTDDEGVNMSETFVRFRPRETWTRGLDKEQIVDEMRERVEAEFKGVTFNFSQPIKDNIEEAISGVRGKVVLKIFGEDLEAMRQTLIAAKAALAKVPGIVDLDLYRDATVPQLQIALDRQALARDGITVATAQTTLETALAGRVVTEVWHEGRPVPVRVELDPAAGSEVARIKALEVDTPAGGRVPLSDLAKVGIADGRAVINREANARFLALKFNVEGRDMGSAVHEAMQIVKDQVKVPEGAFLQWGGEFENQARAMGRLQVIIPVALLIVLALLYGALGSGRAAAAVMLSMPLAVSGGVVALALSNIALSVSAAIGFIALMGQVSLMGLLVLSAVAERRKGGLALAEALVSGPTERFRAVLMAALLGILGLLPMVLSHGVGSETQRPFALVIVGGMVTTLVTALWVLPSLYGLIARKDPDPDAEGDAEEPPPGLHDGAPLAEGGPA
ncbi:MAG: CusA/CzcA family heavy metal efflux RND transporter [Myxococcota bacterium]